MKFILLHLCLFLFVCNPTSSTEPLSELSEPSSELMWLMRKSVSFEALFFVGEVTLGQRLATLQKDFSNIYKQELPIRMEPHVASLPVNIRYTPRESTENPKDSMEKDNPNCDRVSVHDALRFLDHLLTNVAIEYHADEIVITAEPDLADVNVNSENDIQQHDVETNDD